MFKIGKTLIGKELAYRILALVLIVSMVTATVLPFLGDIRPAYALENEPQESLEQETAELPEEPQESMAEGIAMLMDEPDGGDDGPGLNQAGSAIIQASSAIYETGEIIYFILTSNYGAASVEDGYAPKTLDFEIALPGEPFEFIHSGEEFGDGKYIIYVPDGAGLYMIYDSEANTITYPLEAGDTLGATLSFFCPNGTTESGTEITLTPVCTTEIDEVILPDFNVFCDGASSEVTAVFGWDGPTKTVTEYEKSAELEEDELPSFTKGTNLTYTITAENLQKDQETGVVFTKEYTVTDTMTLNNMYFDVTGATVTVTGENDGEKNIVEITKDSETVKLLEVNKAGAVVTPVTTDNKITGFTITYSLENEEPLTKDMADLDMKVYLYGENANAYFRFNPAPTVEPKAYRIDNNVEFEAWSVHWKTEADDTDHYYTDTADKNIEAVGSIDLTKEITDGALEPGGTVTYTIEFTNNDKLYDELWISDLLPMTRTGIEGDVFTDEISNFSIEVTGAGVGQATYDDTREWDIKEPKQQLLTPYSGLVGAEYNATDAKLLYLAKKFENVPVGATIKITYSVTLEDNFEFTSTSTSANRSMPNYAFATSENDLLNSETVLKKAEVSGSITTDRERISTTKIMVDKDEKAITDRKFVKGDIVYYKITIKNTGAAVTAEWLREYWPFAGVELQEIKITDNSTSGDASWSSVKVYNTESDATLVEVNNDLVHDWAQHSISNPAASFIQFNNFVIPAANGSAASTTTLLLTGKIIGEGEFPNKVEIKFKNTTGPGNGTSSIKLDSTLLGVAASKDVYRVAGGSSWPNVNSLTSDKTGHKVGDIIAYGIDVKNNSTDTSLIMDKITVEDTYDEKLSMAGLVPCSGTLNGGTNGSASGVVIARFPDRTLVPLKVSDSSTLIGNAYYIDSVTRKITMQIVDANLQAEGDQKVSFYIFFKVTEALKETLTSENSYVLNNEVKVTGEGKDFGSEHPATTTASVRHIIDIPNNLRAASVYKSVLGVGSKDNDFNKSALGAMTGQYIFYELKLINNSPDGAPLTVYAIHDILPEGTEFVGVADSKTATKVGVVTGQPITLNTFNSVSSSPGKASAKVDISCADGILTITPSDTDHIVEVSGKDSYVSLIVVLKVTEDVKGGYLNTGGFTIDDVRVNHGVKGTPKDGKAKVSDSVKIGGPSYGIGIVKKAAEFKAGSGSWKAIGPNAIINPNDRIRWSITLYNSADSSGALSEYMVVDHLPAEFKYVTDSAKLDGVQLPEPSQVPVTDGDGNLLYTKLTWKITGKPIPAGGSLKLTFESELADAANPKYGSYHNEAFFHLTNNDHNLSKITHGEKTTYDGKTAAKDGDTVAMMGGYATQSVKSVKNITDGSPYETDGTEYTSASSGGKIMAIAGDTIRYTLNITSKTSLGDLKNVVIIDVLPQKGDIGVVNRAVGRNSQFDVKFPNAPNVSVTVGIGQGIVLDADKYTVLYGHVPANINALSENDWSGLAVSGGKVTWSDTPKPNSNAIRVAIDSSVQIVNDAAINVAFDAVVAGNKDTSTLPEISEVAWNSFGYAYSVGSNNIRLYAEPIKVGVEIPYATINVGKTVINPSGENVESDSTPFTLKLLRKAAEGEGWVPAPGVRYTRDGDLSVYITSLDGTFAIKHGESIRLYVPADLAFYKLEEAESSGYQQIYSHSDLSETTPLEGGDDYNVLFVNKLNPAPPLPGEPKPIEITLEATKTLDGAAPGSVSFTFLLRNSSGTVIDSKSNDASGKISFEKLIFEQEGTYNYTISELAAQDDDSYNYDTAVYNVSIGVIKNGDKFDYTVTYTRNSTAYTGIPVFANTTGDGEGGDGGTSIALEARKVYNDHAPTAGAFSFILRDQNGRQLGGSSVNDANGSVRFGSLSFSAEGTYLYRITELNRGVPVINYDTSVYEAEVTVTEVGGELRASVVYFTVNSDGSRTPVPEAFPTFYNTSTRPGPDDPDEIVDIGDPDTPGGAWVPDPENPDEWIFIPEDDDPLADAPGEEDSGTPRTNDTLAASLVASIAVMAAALTGIALMIILPRRRKHRRQ